MRGDNGVKVERTPGDRVSSSDNTAAHRASSAPFEGGLAVVSKGTVLRCLHPHPIQSVDWRPHGATLGSIGGRWLPTGTVLYPIRPKQIQGMDVEDGFHWAYCARCKAATEYERRAA